MRPSFTPNLFWTHVKFMDVVIRVVKRQYSDKKRVKLRVEWWNKSGWYIGVTENITIKKDQFDNWTCLGGNLNSKPSDDFDNEEDYV